MPRLAEPSEISASQRRTTGVAIDAEPTLLARAHAETSEERSAFLGRTELDQIEGALARARARCREERPPDQGGRVAAEWLLDNDYLVRRVLAQLRNELPAGFQERLPRLADPGRKARALALAAELYDGVRHELEIEELEAFLTEYQTVTALTIAELWALPAMLRLVILHRLLAALRAAFDASDAQEARDAGADCGRAIRALRLLAEADWNEIFSRLSVTERILRGDPAGAYERMDFDTRDAYRRAVEEIARGGALPETEVATAAISRAEQARGDERRYHVGYHLLGAGRPAFERALGVPPTGLERHIRDHPRAAFFGVLIAAQAVLLAPVFAYLLWLDTEPGMFLLALLLCWVPASVPAATLQQWLLAKIVRPVILPKLDFGQGIPGRWRTLVAVPALLGDRSQIDRLVGQLEVHYLGNPDPELRFALLTDHVDVERHSGETPPEELEARLEHARRHIQELNTRYGRDGSGPFHLLHRESQWNPAERRWMGWERKRGKLEELNRLLLREGETSYSVHAGDPDGLEGVAFVLTLDSDTQLPSGAAARLVGTLAHPLNRPVFDAAGRVESGYTVLQPRVEISPRSARSSAFTRLFSGDTGIDIYTRAVSETYQDLFGEGIYVGKGIYDVAAFSRSLRGRVPENRLLSHDLFEGIHGRAALVTDVAVYEDYPSHYAAYLHRMHRWVRGDWQLLPWLFPTVPVVEGEWAQNRLTAVDRFKILDNLRRSLLSPAVLALLLSGWTFLPGHPLFWTVLALVAPGAAAVWSLLRPGTRSRRELGRWFLAICFAPPEAMTTLDAIVRALVRMAITGRGLLEWTTADEAAAGLDGSRREYVLRLWAGPLVSAAIALGLVLGAPGVLLYASPWLLLWLLSPELAWRISRRTPRAPRELDPASIRVLRQVARRTWLFFETFVGPGDNWLPIDNFQEHPRGVEAHRTSPTNIGMLLLSQLAAYDLGYVGVIGLATRAANTLDSLERLERYRGHIYNWYDTQTLRPLEPRYVSTVDSGNLAGALLALAVGCEQAAVDPLLRPQLRVGLRDTTVLLTDAVARWAEASRAGSAAREAPTSAALEASELVRLLAAGTTCDVALLEKVRARVQAIDGHLLSALREGGEVSRDPGLLRELRVWLDRLTRQLEEAEREAEMLTSSAAASGPPTARERRRRLMGIARRARALAEGMDFAFLYDRERRLLHIGFNVSADRMDPHHYDLLASEARLASFIAITHGQLPVKHWFALGRPLTRAGRRGPSLLSWGGSMFEYLMPLLLMRSHEDTLLAVSCEGAVDRQVEHGREHGTPWGVSESGYAFLDGRQAYQYRSFGVPGLGLRRGLEEDVVIAPYASILALSMRPRTVVANLLRLDDLGALGRFGFYEALDFHPLRAPGGRPAIVRSYMSHHHGMSLVAIANYLTAQATVRRFHAEPRTKSGALLLDERVPLELHAERPSVEEGETTDVGLLPPGPLPGWGPERRARQVWAVGNDRLTTYVTAAGGGGLARRDLTVSRWEPDPVRDTHGTHMYVSDQESGESFGIAPEDGGEGRVVFEAGAVELHRRYSDLAVRTRVTVATGADVELREVRVSNEGERPRRLRVTACLEPALAPEREAARHPAFSKLFLRCTPVPDLAGITVMRISREGDLPPMLHFRAVAGEGGRARIIATDREAFLGRHGSLDAPAGLAREPGPTADETLDPLCVCAVDVALAPGEQAVVAFVAAVAQGRSEVMELARRFGTLNAVRWAFEDAERAASLRVERLDVAPDTVPAIQRLLSALLFPDPRRRAAPHVLAKGRPSQPKLWARGISGDDPIVLVRLEGGEEDGLLGDVLAAHRYLRSLGMRFDVVVLDDAPSGYLSAGPEHIRRMLGAQGGTALLGQRGGIHVVPSDQAREGELSDVAAAAVVYLEAGAGSLSTQLAAPGETHVELPAFDPVGLPPGSPPDPDLRLDVPELEWDNEIGGFDKDEYVVRPGARPPAPWCNVIANEKLGCLVSEAALGSTWSLNAGENRLTPWHNDPVSDPPSEVLYLRDEETALVWSTTPLPAGGPTLVRHGQGHSRYHSSPAGLEQTMTVFVPPDLPLKIVRLHVRNAAPRPRRLTATYYAEWVLGARRPETRPHIRSDLSSADCCMLAESSWSVDFAGRVAFLASDRPFHGCTADRVEMLGRGGSLARPAGLARWGLSGRLEPGVDPCAALQVHVELGPGESTELSFFLGQAEDRERALDLVRGMRRPGAVEEAWTACRAYWERMCEAVRVRTPDPGLDRLCNGWLPYQSLASRFFGRTAFYQSSGAYGFRDQLQDSLALLHSDPALTRDHLLESAAHQFEEGDVLHWWHPPSGVGVRTRCSDDLLWLVYVTHAYVEATGDLGVLEESRPFLVGEPLARGQDTRYGHFEQGEEASLLEHCRRALRRGFTSGPHGLPLIGDGDWNDGMNRVGAAGRGESVWLGWFSYDCVRRFAELLDRLGGHDEAERWRGRLPELAGALAEHGWDGGWYRRAYYDDGAPIGSVGGEPPHIDSIAQSWAVLSGAADPERAAEAIASAERLLVDEEHRLVLLLDPPFGLLGHDAGYIAAYPPGVRENGGQYTHAAIWLGFAHAARGDGEAAHRVFSLLNPLERTRTAAEVARYRVEPYVIAADVYGRPPFVGRGGWTWYTGSAAWMWRLGVEAILGLRRRDGALEVDPCLPPSWPGFEATVRAGELRVHVLVHNDGAGKGVARATLDGRAQDRARVELTGAGERRLVVWLGGDPALEPA